MFQIDRPAAPATPPVAKETLIASREVGVACVSLTDSLTKCELVLDDDTRHLIDDKAADVIMRLWQWGRVARHSCDHKG